MKYLIYSYEHSAWWRPGSRGYTWDIAQAGEYDEAEAREICEGANSHRSPHYPNEEMVPARVARAAVRTELERMDERRLLGRTTDLLLLDDDSNPRST